MKPQITGTTFGSISVGDERYEKDIYISSDGNVRKRKKKLSKAIYGTSHTISLDEIRYLFEKGSEGIVVGTGQYGVAKLSDEACSFLEKRGCRIILKPTPQAIEEWNRAKGKWIGLFHITC